MNRSTTHFRKFIPGLVFFDFLSEGRLQLLAEVGAAVVGLARRLVAAGQGPGVVAHHLRSTEDHPRCCKSRNITVLLILLLVYQTAHLILSATDCATWISPTTLCHGVFRVHFVIQTYVSGAVPVEGYSIH